MLKTRNRLKQLLLFTLMFVFVLGLAACEEREDPIDEGPELVTIESALTQAEQGDEIRIQGTIYYVQENGIYLSDSSIGNIFVSTTTLPDEAFELIVGLEIELIGTFERTQNKPIISEVSYLELLNDQADPVMAVRTDVQDLVSLSPTALTGRRYSFVERTSVTKIDPITLQLVFVDD